MTNRHRAALWLLSDTDIESVGWKIQDLEEADAGSSACMVVNVWKPFEDYTVAKLLEELDKLEEQFDACQLDNTLDIT